MNLGTNFNAVILDGKCLYFNYLIVCQICWKLVAFVNVLLLEL